MQFYFRPVYIALDAPASARHDDRHEPTAVAPRRHRRYRRPPVSQTGFIYYPSTSQFWFTLSSGQSITVSYSGTGCSGSTIATRSFNVGGHYYVISPNPASGTITISPNSNSSISKATIGKASITQVSITDVNGILKKQQQFSVNSATMQLNVADLIPGTYFVQITNGDIHDTQQLIINR